MSKCVACGFESEKEYAFCPKCGKKMKNGQSLGNVESADELHSKGVDYLLGKNGVAQDNRKAFEYNEKAAKLGHSEANNLLGILYSDGIGVAPNFQKAVECFEQAGKLGNTTAIMNLWNMYYRGHSGARQDFNKAFEYCKWAADLGNTNAIKFLGDMYKQGEGVERDYNKAIDCYTRAEGLGNAEATVALGNMYREGSGVEKSTEKAIEYFKRAEEHDSSSAMFNLGKMYFEGIDVEKNVEMGVEYLKKAASLGNKDAQKYIDSFPAGGSSANSNYANSTAPAAGYVMNDENENGNEWVFHDGPFSKIEKGLYIANIRVLYIVIAFLFFWPAGLIMLIVSKCVSIKVKLAVMALFAVMILFFIIGGIGTYAGF